MAIWHPGDDVIVKFDGGKFHGEVLKVETSGYVLCKIHIDPEWDFGRVGPMLAPESIVAVRIGNLRPHK